MTETNTYCVDRARAGWKGKPPDWVIELACEADRTSQSRAAKKLRYSVTVINQTLSNSYCGNLARIEAAVRGLLMGDTVMCPIVGEIFRDRCLSEQRNDMRGTSGMRTMLYHKCRSGDCPHSYLKAEKRHG